VSRGVELGCLVSHRDRGGLHRRGIAAQRSRRAEAAPMMCGWTARRWRARCRRPVLPT
jgi:hypothetical protein